jgi:hypothetical protein
MLNRNPPVTGGQEKQTHIRTNACAGFTVQTLLMDNEFEKVWDHVTMLNFNTTAADEHVGKVELLNVSSTN